VVGPRSLKKPNVEGFRSHVFAGGLIGVTIGTADAD
jgi:hypothetical protein